MKAGFGHRADIHNGPTPTSSDQVASHTLGYEKPTFVRPQVSIIVFFRVFQERFRKELISPTQL